MGKMVSFVARLGGVSVDRVSLTVLCFFVSLSLSLSPVGLSVSFVVWTLLLLLSGSSLPLRLAYAADTSGKDAASATSL